MFIFKFEVLIISARYHYNFSKNLNLCYEIAEQVECLSWLIVVALRSGGGCNPLGYF